MPPPSPWLASRYLTHLLVVGLQTPRPGIRERPAPFKPSAECHVPAAVFTRLSLAFADAMQLTRELASLPTCCRVPILPSRRPLLKLRPDSTQWAAVSFRPARLVCNSNMWSSRAVSSSPPVLREPHQQREPRLSQAKETSRRLLSSHAHGRSVLMHTKTTGALQCDRRITHNSLVACAMLKRALLAPSMVAPKEALARRRPSTSALVCSTVFSCCPPMLEPGSVVGRRDLQL